MGDFDPNASGVYSITTPSGRVYVGSAVKFGRRWSQHKSQLRRGTHHNAPLQAAANKYGLDALVFRPILYAAPINVVMYEQIAIHALNPACNTAPVAGSTLGYRHTDETKAKFPLRRKAESTGRGKPRSDEVKAKISAAKLGKPVPSRQGVPVSQETRARISATLTGRVCGPMSDEHKAKIGAANRGRVPSAETLARLSVAQRGVKQSPETIAKRVAALAGRQWTDEQRAKHKATWAAKAAAGGAGRVLTPAWRAALSAAGRGRVCSDETKAKIGAALRGRKYPASGAKSAAAKTGRPRSPEAIAKHRATCAAKRAARAAA